MKTWTRFALALFVPVILSGAVPRAWAAYLEEEPDQRPSRVAPEPTIIRPVPPPPYENALQRLVRAVDVGRPYTYRGLAVYPLVLRERWGEAAIRTLEEALARDWITIREMDTARVSELLVRNESRAYVFLMAGEILAGGRQDRIIRSDVLLEPRSDLVAVPVYCGEQNRWAGPRDAFESARHLADQSLRSLAGKAAPQGAIWSEIDEQLKRAEVAAPTRSYRDIYADRKVGRELDEHVAHFRDVPGRRTVGAVIAARGRILSCDLFGDAELFAGLWDKICRSHAVDVILKAGDFDRKTIWPEPPDHADIRRFLDGTLSAHFTRDYTPGAGELLRISGPVEGNTLIWRDRVVHAVLFAGDRIRPMPLDDEPAPERRR